MKKHLYTALMVVFAAIFLVSSSFVVSYFWDSHKQQSEFQELANLVQKNTVATPADPEDAELSIYTEIIDPNTGKPMKLLTEYAEVYQKNTDVVGWLKIEGTNINYPVMQTPDRTDYYLRRGFDKKYSRHGCLYARELCDIFTPSDNITIYGHKMQDGSMFAALHSYKKQDFFESHRYIQFDTLYQRNTYEILAVFLTTATEGEGFPYHRFVEAENQSEFDQFISTCKELSYYETGVTAQYGDKLITLSTCDYSRSNGRLAVVAKQVTEN